MDEPVGNTLVFTNVRCQFRLADVKDCGEKPCICFCSQQARGVEKLLVWQLMCILISRSAWQRCKCEENSLKSMAAGRIK